MYVFLLLLCDPAVILLSALLSKKIASSTVFRAQLTISHIIIHVCLLFVLGIQLCAILTDATKCVVSG